MLRIFKNKYHSPATCNFLSFIQSSGQFGINYAFKKFQNDKDRDKVQDMNVRLGGR